MRSPPENTLSLETMTPEQTEELEALKAALKQHIEEAEKATPEPREYGNEAVWNEEMNGEGNSPEEVCYSINKSDGLFIARARTMSPLACRIALTGIEALEKISSSGFIEHTSLSKLGLKSQLRTRAGEDADTQLSSILS